MPKVRCSIHDLVFDTKTDHAFPGSDASHPIKDGTHGHPDCPRCAAEADGPKFVTTDEAQAYADKNNVDLDVAMQALAEQGFGVSDDQEVHEKAGKERADKAARQAKRVAASERKVSPSGLPAYEAESGVAASSPSGKIAGDNGYTSENRDNNDPRLRLKRLTEQADKLREEIGRS